MKYYYSYFIDIEMEAQRVNNIPKVIILEGGRNGTGSQSPWPSASHIAPPAGPRRAGQQRALARGPGASAGVGTAAVSGLGFHYAPTVLGSNLFKLTLFK